jgi:hypothetical protein
VLAREILGGRHRVAHGVVRARSAVAEPLDVGALDTAVSAGGRRVGDPLAVS